MELKLHDHEILLQELWKSRKLFTKEMQTVNGRRVEVIFAGRENLDAGPDFKDAVIKLDGRLLRGDVEVHLDSSGWYSHGHHQDSAYNNVILHLISEKVGNSRQVEREDGVEIEQVCVDIQTYKQASWKQPNLHSKSRKPTLIVAECPLSREEDARKRAIINQAAIKRLQEKADRFKELLLNMSSDQLIYMHILEAMGYSKNQIPFRKLAQLLPVEKVIGEMQWVSDEMALQKCTALFFGAAGLLPSQNNKRHEILSTEVLSHVAPLEVLWNQLSHRLELKPMQPHEWQFFRLRPQNFPSRRLAGMAHIVHKFFRQGFLEGLLKIIHGHRSDHKIILTELEESFIVKTEGYWRHHFHFLEDEFKIKAIDNPTLIGKSRARDIVVNIVLPVLFLHSKQSQDGILNNLVKALYAKFPKLSDNEITRAMKTQLSGGSRKSIDIRTASQQQALIFLHKLYCRPLRCEDCLSLAP